MLSSNNSSTTSLHQQFVEMSMTSTTTKTSSPSLSSSASPPLSPSFLEDFCLPPIFQLDIEVPNFVLRRRNAVVEAILNVPLDSLNN